MGSIVKHPNTARRAGRIKAFAEQPRFLHVAVYANTPIELINAVYGTLDERLAKGRERLGRALTLTEKILINHLDDVDNGGMDRGVSYTDLSLIHI